MKARPSIGSSFRVDTGPPGPENVGPAGQQPGGPNQRFQRRIIFPSARIVKSARRRTS
jgi:hypothetical protein